MICSWHSFVTTLIHPKDDEVAETYRRVLLCSGISAICWWLICLLLLPHHLPPLLPGFISYSYLQRVTEGLFSQIKFLMCVQFIGFGIHQVSSCRKWHYRARNWNSAVRSAVRLEWTGRLMYDSRLPEAILRRSWLQVDNWSVPPSSSRFCQTAGTAFYAYNRLSSFIGARQCMTESRLSQNDGCLLYLCCEVREKLTFREHNTEIKEIEDGGTSLMLNKVNLKIG